jgi:phosphoribosylformylglycinamidine synthase I
VRFGVVVFPGTWSGQDCHYALDDIMGQEVGYVWHNETDLSGYDCIVLPGGFSYGDYLRLGAIARFSPVMISLDRFASQGGLVIGICNRFQILCESGLLPGMLLKNDHLQYRCQWSHVRVENDSVLFTSGITRGRVLKIPVSHYEGRYYADDVTLDELEAEKRIVFRYTTYSGEVTGEANPDGSLHNIAGIVNKVGNVLGIMPHPEHACEHLLGSVDGNSIWESVIASFQRNTR